MTIRCDQCQQDVKCVTAHYNPQQLAYYVTVHCHGESKVVIISDYDLALNKDVIAFSRIKDMPNEGGEGSNEYAFIERLKAEQRLNEALETQKRLHDEVVTALKADIQRLNGDVMTLAESLRLMQVEDSITQETVERLRAENKALREVIEKANPILAFHEKLKTNGGFTKATLKAIEELIFLASASAYFVSDKFRKTGEPWGYAVLTPKDGKNIPVAKFNERGEADDFRDLKRKEYRDEFRERLRKTQNLD